MDTHSTCDSDSGEETVIVPFVLYQNVKLAIDLKNETINGSTMIWLGYACSITEVSTISLHCRQCNIRSIKVNGSECKYDYVDPLLDLKYDRKNNEKNSILEQTDFNHSFNGEELDIAYRAALEISRSGELKIYLPHDVSIDTVPLPPLPSQHSPYTEIGKRYEKLNNLYYSLAAPSMSRDSTIGIDRPVSHRMLQVEIEYYLDKNKNSKGYVFRSMQNDTTRSNCIYSTNGSNIGCLRNIDGIRCWMPCIDSPDQRSIYDMTISYSPGNLMCISPGLLVSKESYKDNHKDITSVRHFTINRIPAMSVGFFIGRVESYSMPLYKLKGVMMVAVDLIDYKNGIYTEDMVNEKNINNNHNEAKRQKVNKENIGNYDGDNGIEISSLYCEKVRHTTLGLDLGLKYIHKLIGRKYDQNMYTQIFISNLSSSTGLSSELILSYDGFSLLDASVLHTKEYPLKESTAHFHQILAYMYSWFKSGLPIDCYHSEYIVHGTIGYILNKYTENIYGEEEGQHRLQKMIDFIVTLYKQGYQDPLVTFFPESYECFTPIYRQMMYYKSTVLMHIIGNRIQGKDKMRNVIGTIVKSSLLYQQRDNNLSTLITAIPSVPLYTSSSPQNNINDSGSESPSPYVYGFESPPYYSRARSDSIDEQNSPNYLNLQRQSSITSDPGWEGDLSVLSYECISVDTLTKAIQTSSGIVTIFTNEFFDQYIYDNNLLFLRVTATIGNVGEKSNAIINVEPIGKGTGNIVHDVKLQIIEKIDSYFTEVTIGIGDKPIKYQKPLHTRAGRKEGYRKPRLSVDKEPRLVDEIKLGKEVDYTKNAILLSRETEYAIKNVYIDPLQTNLGEVHICGPDSILVEQLFSNEEKSAFHYIQALRCLTKLSNNNDKSKSNILQLKALSDCLCGIVQLNTNKTTINGIMTTPHSAQVRTEAAYSLGHWQNERAPQRLISSQLIPLYDIFSHYPNESGYFSVLNYLDNHDYTWHGLAFLLEALKSMFMENGRSITIDGKLERPFRPITIDFASEDSYLIRNSIIVSLSSIRCQHGFTPSIIAIILVIFLDDAITKIGENQTDTIHYNQFHFISTLLLCLSRVVIDPNGKDITKSMLQSINIDINCNIPNGILLLSEIIDKVQKIFTDELTYSVAIAKIRFSTMTVDTTMNCGIDRRLEFPRLTVEGMIAASAITCLGEFDNQILSLNNQSGNLMKSINSFSTKRIDCNLAIHKSSNGLYYPTGKGVMSYIDYVKYFMPDGQSLKFVKNITREKQSMHHESIFLTLNFPPLLRQAALEVFVKKCFTLHFIYRDKISRKSPDNSTECNESSLMFVAAAIEAINTVLSFDNCKNTRQAAATLLCDTLQDKPVGRVCWSALTLGELWNCYGFSDPLATSLDNCCTHASSMNGFKRSRSMFFRQAIKGHLDSVHLAEQLFYLWKYIIQGSNNDIGIRSTLISAWILAFPHRAPRCLDAFVNKQEIRSDLGDIDPFFENILPTERLLIKDPYESHQKFELALRNGPQFQFLPPRNSSSIHNYILDVNENLDEMDNSMQQKSVLSAKIRTSSQHSGPTLRISLPLSASKSKQKLDNELPTPKTSNIEAKKIDFKVDVTDEHKAQDTVITFNSLKRNNSIKIVFK